MRTQKQQVHSESRVNTQKQVCENTEGGKIAYRSVQGFVDI